jgi:hypothetical protein
VESHASPRMARPRALMLDQAIQEGLGQARGPQIQESGAMRIFAAAACFALDGPEPHDLVELNQSDR